MTLRASLLQHGAERPYRRFGARLFRLCPCKFGGFNQREDWIRFDAGGTGDRRNAGGGHSSKSAEHYAAGRQVKGAVRVRCHLILLVWSETSAVFLGLQIDSKR